ncbi:MAG: Nitrate reductase, large subunit [Ilumatobacteraceae bacterium]|nr:Nitrate reductase, large subunit [Ilumatobacteraceae bacterium]
MVCLCHGVSERKVERAIAHGATSVDDVGAACRAGTSCGICRQTIQEMIVTCVSVHARTASFA